MISSVHCTKMSFYPEYSHSAAVSQPYCKPSTISRMLSKKGDCPVFLVTREYLRNHILVELKLIHCGSPFQKSCKLFIRTKVGIVTWVCDRSKVTLVSPELGQETTPLAVLQKEILSSDVGCACTVTRSYGFLILIDRLRHFHISL